ncbi:MAG: alpha/beta fold hydrolase [Labilithrix sp.]|nr:alpha/beta fold hydrolase [Labilithrix sp.]MCW5811931.1 alpha/beta fold hydrolase [Labilithrix sp.]
MAYVRTRLGRLFYEERGAARRKGDPAIVLLHGLLFDGGMWRGQIEALASRGRVLVFDGPGHGKSEPAPRFMLEDHADALFDAFGELGVDRAVVVGLSWGGMVGMRLALQHPEKVKALALLDTSASAEPLPEKIKNRAFIALHRRLGFPYGLYLREVAPKMFASRTIAERPDLVLASYKRVMGFHRGGMSRAAIAVMIHRKDIKDRLGRINVPTLVLCGAEDRATVPAESEAIAERVPGAELVLLDGLGHMSALEDPEAVNARLVPFVAKCFE